MKHYKLVIFVLLMVALSSCKSALLKSSDSLVLADKNATPSTKYLLARIKKLSEVGYAFGHQDATAYGIGWKNDGSSSRSDVFDVVGDHPAVYGFEIGHIENNAVQNLDTVNFGLMAKLIKNAHRKGGIISISWHPDNPNTKKSAWDNTRAVPYILEGGALKAKYDAWLATVAKFLNGLETDKGEKIPIVFRPFHEMNGNWFWWGRESCTPEEYKQLWRETFTTLTEVHQVRNILYCYSTDAVKDSEEYLQFYPGDSYVDVLGIDLYHKNTTEEYEALLNDNLGMLSKISENKGMPFAMSEGGLERIPVEDWWTQVLDKNVATKGLAWVLVWRNANTSHFYAPYRGHTSASDFLKFKKLNHVLFLDDVRNIK